MSEKNRPSILIVDDEHSIRESFSLIFEGKYNVHLAASGESALKKLVDEKIDLVFLDIRMHGLDGIETLRKIIEIDKDIDVIMVTAVNDVSKANEAVKLGARDYVVKPFDVEKILSLTEKILKRKEFKEIDKALWIIEVEDLIGESRAIRNVLEIIEKVSQEDTGITIFGEKGVEGEAVALKIHKDSKRSSKPFVVFNVNKECENVLREKLFGSGRGFSPEMLEKEKGLLEKANGGTIFLRNIQNLPILIQEELAKALAEKMISRIGSLSSIPIDVRIIVQTSENLKDFINQGIFSQKLYEIISEVYIELPPLRERAGDIPILLNYYLDLFCRIFNKTIEGYSEASMDILSSYDYPMNTEELKSLVKYIVLTKKDEQKVKVEDIPLDILIKFSLSSLAEEGKRIYFESSYSTVEKSFIQKVLLKFQNDVIKAANMLGLSLSAFKTKIGSE